MLKLKSLGIGLVLSVLSVTGAVAEKLTPVDAMAAFYEVADARPFDREAFVSFFSETHTNHDPRPGQTNESSGDIVADFYKSLQDGSSDGRHEITFIEPVGESKALVRWRYVGTHDGPLFGIPASGNEFDAAGMELWEFDENGKINGLWHVEEIATLLRQITKKP
ncbi:ester cyclase [Pseudovibrio denitrificans]|nr:ester cyclase [Pseudovibrio denitrificans]